MVSIPATICDKFGETAKCERIDELYLLEMADYFISEDGKEGEIPHTINEGGWPILLTHWWSLVSGGRETGLKILDIVGGRVHRHLSDRIVWKNSMELAHIAAKMQ